jgi:hypothetical protein
MLYYRGTKSNNPMSDWGHAMFVDDYENSYSGLGHEWAFDGSLATPITSLKDKIIAAWGKTLENGYYYGFSSDDNDYFMTLSAEEVFDSFNPDDIVDSADGFDSALVSWLSEMVLMPNEIYAVTTQDGAVVFDASLITELGND